MAWATEGTGDRIVSTKGSVWVSKAEYDKLKQKYENCEEQNQRFRKQIGELKGKLADKLNPIERLGYELFWKEDGRECYISHEWAYKIYVNKTLLLADFRMSDKNDSPRGATVSEMKAVAEYLEGGE